MKVAFVEKKINKQKMFIKIAIVLVIISICTFTFYANCVSANIGTKQTAEDIFGTYTREKSEDLNKRSNGYAVASLVLTLLPFVITIGYIGYVAYYIYKTGKKIKEPMGLLYISFIIPIVGLILYCVYVKQNEVLAKKCGIFALLGILIPFVFLFGVLSFGSAKMSTQSLSM